MMILDIIIAVVVIVIIILLFSLKNTNVPKRLYKSKVIYSDHKKKPGKVFFSSKYGLAGKPDFILCDKDGNSPLEIKRSKRPEQPYFSDVMQFISYCLLMEESGMKIDHGYIQYKNGKPFIIPYTNGLKNFLFKTLNKMRSFTDEGPKPFRRNKCKNCKNKNECFK